MEHIDELPGAATVNKYLASDNEKIKTIVGMVAGNVTAAAKLAARNLVRDREHIAEIADHLDNEFITELNVDQSEEIKEITRIEKELGRYFDNTIIKLAFRHYDTVLLKHVRELERKEAELRDRERDIERIISKRISKLRKQITRDSTTARGFFESAVAKAEKHFDQNKITRFAYSTISLFQEEFFNLQGTHDIGNITKLYQKAIEPYQITKMVMEKDGKLKKVITNQFTNDCSPDLFLFFYTYYNELLNIYHTEGILPPTADELARIFHKRKKDVSEIISKMQPGDKIR